MRSDVQVQTPCDIEIVLFVARRGTGNEAVHVLWKAFSEI